MQRDGEIITRIAADFRREMKLRQQRVDQALLMGGKLRPLAAAIKLAALTFGVRAFGRCGHWANALRRRAPEGLFYQNARLIWSARSVFSHEKPPSASGSRPKWP